MRSFNPRGGGGCGIATPLCTSSSNKISSPNVSPSPNDCNDEWCYDIYDIKKGTKAKMSGDKFACHAKFAKSGGLGYN
jgi:hypothetical protein